MTNICAIDSMVSPQLARISRGQSNTLLICVSRYNLITQTWVNDVPFIVGHDGDFGQSKAMGLLSNPRHVAKGNPGQDLCVVPAKPIERQTIGGGMSTQDGVLIERIIEILSSPGKRDLYQFWTAISRIIPVMIERGRNYYVIGMHKESDLKSNSALYLSLGCLSKMSCAPVRIGGARKEIMATAQECRLETLQQLLSARDWRVRQATMQGLSVMHPEIWTSR